MHKFSPPPKQKKKEVSSGIFRHDSPHGSSFMHSSAICSRIFVADSELLKNSAEALQLPAEHLMNVKAKQR